MENLELNHAKTEINLLTKHLQNWKRECGELILSKSEIERQLTELTHQNDDLHHQLTAANETPNFLKQQHEVQIRDLNAQIQLLKKQNQQLSNENGELEAKKVMYEEELRELKTNVAKFEEEKEEIMKKVEEEFSRVSKMNEKLSRDFSAVVDVATDKFRTLEKRLSIVEKDVVNLTRYSFPSGSLLVNTPPVMQEQESFGPETNTNGLVGAQSGPEMTHIEEKTASSMPSPKGITTTCVKGQPQSFESNAIPARPVGADEKSSSSMPCNRKTSSADPIDLCSSDDEGKEPSSKGLKRKLHSTDASYKMGDGGSSGEYRLKGQIDLSPDEALNPSKKTILKWDFEADLLDDLQKDTELCMMGICALYRQRMLCAIRETSLAKSLIGGAKTLVNVDIDPDDCRRIALAHSRQLFDIYKNGKDPLFAHEKIFC